MRASKLTDPWTGGGTGAYRSCGVYVFVWAGKRMPHYRFFSKLMKVLSERGGGKKRNRERERERDRKKAPS